MINLPNSLYYDCMMVEMIILDKKLGVLEAEPSNCLAPLGRDQLFFIVYFFFSWVHGLIFFLSAANDNTDLTFLTNLYIFLMYKSNKCRDFCYYQKFNALSIQTLAL